MNHKRKIIIFERLAFFSSMLAIVYCKIGFDVMYFVISEKMKESRYFKIIRQKISISQIPEKQFSINVKRFANELVLNNIDLFFKAMLIKNKSIKIIATLFKSDLIQSVYKKIISEKLLSFYIRQIRLNKLIEDASLNQIYYVPSEEFMYFMNLSHQHGLFHILYILDRKIKIPKYSYIINIWAFLFKKIVQNSLLALWPFVLIKNVKKIILRNIPPREYVNAIRIYKTGFNFNSKCRSIDFLLDGENITKQNTLFCIETEIDNDFRDSLIMKDYHFVDIPKILGEINWGFIRKIYFGILLPVWLKLYIISFLELNFVVYSYRAVLGGYLRWKIFLDKYNIKNFVVYNDFNFTHIIRNILLSQKGIKTWYYMHSSHTVHLFTPQEANSEIRSVYLSYLYYDNFISWGKRLSSFYMNPYNNISNFINIGCLWSEHIRRITETDNYSGILNQIYEKYKKNANINKKIIGVFDTSFGGEGNPLISYDIKCFLEGILKLKDERNDIVFVIKLKNQLRHVEEWAPDALPYYEKIKRSANCYFLEDLHDPSMVNAICDLNISACFTSTVNEAIGYRKKAIYFDAADNFRGYYYDRFPNLVAHGYDELVRLVDYWLYDIKDEEFSKYIDSYIKDELDSYADGYAITRFRKLLTT